MTLWTFDEPALLEGLSRLPHPFVLLFAARCAEALQPAYAGFCAQTGRGDEPALRDALDLVWAAARAAPDPDRVRRAADVAESLVPEEDDDWVDASAQAQCAAAAVHYALRLVLDGSLEWAVAVAEQEHQAADQAVLYESDATSYTEALERQVLADPRVQAALGGQRRRLQVLLDAAAHGLDVGAAAERLREA